MRQGERVSHLPSGHPWGAPGAPVGWGLAPAGLKDVFLKAYTHKTPFVSINFVLGSNFKKMPSNLLSLSLHQVAEPCGGQLQAPRHLPPGYLGSG